MLDKFLQEVYSQKVKLSGCILYIMKILLLEDDFIYNESIKEYLEDRGFKVDSFSNGDDALDAIMQNNYYLMLLDIKVPKLNGHKLMEYIRDIGDKTPIIIMTSLVDIDNISFAYELGCNDYLKKPFELKELELRINCLLKKQYGEDSDSLYSLGENYTFDIISGILKNDFNEIDLTFKEKELIRYFIKRKNYYCEIEELRENVWEGKEINYADIRMYIRKIRIKTYKDFILSSRGLGYKIAIPKI